MITIKGKIKSVIFHNPTTNYSVMRLTNNTTVTGYIPPNIIGLNLELNGEWKTHSKYGEQFIINDYKIIKQDDLENIILYLSSGILEGVGKGYASKIVNYFGHDTLDILNTDIEKVKEVPGIGKSKFTLIKSSWEEHAKYANTIIKLQSFGLSPMHCAKLTEAYGEGIIDLINHNPYYLCFIDDPVPFQVADRIANQLGFNAENEYRVKAAIKFVLKDNIQNGNVYLPEDIFAQLLMKEFNIDLFFQYSTLRKLLDDGELIKKANNYYLTEIYDIEKEIENYLNIFINKKIKAKKINISFEEYSAEQIEAIKLSFECGIMVLTGGPGTGKTTTLKGIIKYHLENNEKVLLAAPTGRAAKRINEVTGFEAKTIHRLLEYNPVTGLFNKNDSAQLDCNLIVIDEASMIDYYLFHNLLKAIPTEANILIIGDANQLPAIGPGNLLSDIINSNIVPLIHLTKIFRQAETSNIIVNAHKIINGQIPDLQISKDSDFFFIEKDNSAEIPDLIIDLVQDRLPSNYNFNSLTDIQILSPMYRGNAGVDNLNLHLQNKININDYFSANLLKKLKPNDKIMQTVNNYDKEIFNGDIGFITAFIKNKENLIVNFWDNEKSYKLTEIEELTLAYATTVHKSQGSEYPCVILVLTSEHSHILNRNLLYTAMTRAKKLLIIIGSKVALNKCVNNTKGVKRFTSLFS